MMKGYNTGSNETAKRIPKNSQGVEIGVWKGETTEKFLKNASFMNLVDPWSVEPIIESKEHGTLEEYINRYRKIVGSKNPEDFYIYFENVYNKVKEKMKNQPVEIYRMKSKDWFEQNQKTDWDWIYVDGDHTYNGCYFDLENSFQIIRKGGILFGDDYTNKKEVRRAVDDFVSKNNLELEIFGINQFSIKKI